MLDAIFQRIKAICESCDAEFPVMPATHLYNEGWMLRLVLDGNGKQKSHGAPDDILTYVSLYYIISPHGEIKEYNEKRIG